MRMPCSIIIFNLSPIKGNNFVLIFFYNQESKKIFEREKTGMHYRIEGKKNWGPGLLGQGDYSSCQETSSTWFWYHPELARAGQVEEQLNFEHVSSTGAEWWSFWDIVHGLHFFSWGEGRPDHLLATFHSHIRWFTNSQYVVHSQIEPSTSYESRLGLMPLFQSWCCCFPSGKCSSLLQFLPW